MKAFNLLLVISVLLVGCRATKKLSESSAVISNQTESVYKADVKEETKVNNDKTTYKKTTITETEYLTPDKPTNESNTSSGSIGQTEAKSVVKAVKVTVIEEGTKDNSKIEINKSDNSEVATKTEDKSKVENLTVEKKSVPIQWGWIFGILSIISVLIFYFRKSPFISAIWTRLKG